MKLDTNPSHIKAINFENKKMLIRSDQTGSARGKNIVVDDSAPPKMINPKNAKVGVWKVNEKNNQAPRPKPTVSMLLKKYTSCKADNVCNRLGRNKRLRSPSRHGGHERWRENSYNKQPYFSVAPTYWCYPPMYPQYPPWGFSPSTPYHTWPADYFQPGRITSRHLFRPGMHEKRSCFNQRARSRDTIVVRGSRSPVHIADGKNYHFERKRVWVPVKRSEPQPVKSSEDLDVGHDLKLREHQSAEGDVPKPKTSHVDVLGYGSVQGIVTSTKQKRVENTLVGSSSTSIGKKSESDSIYAVSANLFPMIVKSGICTSMQRRGSTTRGSRIFEASGPSYQQKVFSAKYREFAPKTTVREYTPRYTWGSVIKPVAPITKPGSQWCPTGLTHTQKRRVQRLRTLEMREITKKKREEWFNRDRPRVPTKIWKKKYTTAEENKKLDDTTADKSSENKNDAPVGIDVTMAVTLPADFRAPDAEVAELVLGPKNAMFGKPEKPEQHLKPLFIKGHIDGKPMDRILVDGGADGNIMPLSVFSKLNRKESELIKTNMEIRGFSGELSAAKGVIFMELMVGSKTLPTAFFVVDIRGRYNILLGRDWIHANCCIPSTLHQCLIQWVDDDVEVIEADNSIETPVDWQHGEMRCLTGRDLSDYDYINIGRDGFVPYKRTAG
jgi:hypothetical protein